MTNDIEGLEFSYYRILEKNIVESSVGEAVVLDYVAITPNKGVEVSVSLKDDSDRKTFNFEKLKNYASAKHSVASQWFNTIYFEFKPIASKYQKRQKKLIIWENHPSSAKHLHNEKQAIALVEEGKQQVIVTSALAMLKYWEDDDNPYEIIIVCEEGSMSLDVLLHDIGHYSPKEVRPGANIYKLWRAGKFKNNLDPITPELNNLLKGVL